MNSNARLENISLIAIQTHTLVSLLQHYTSINTSSIKIQCNQHKEKSQLEIRQLLIDKIKVLYHIRCKKRLQLLETLSIKSNRPKITSNIGPNILIIFN